MVARNHDGRRDSDKTGFLVRTIVEGQGFQTPEIRAVLRQIRRAESGPDTYVFQVDVGSGEPLIVEIQADDLTLSRGECTVGIQHRKGAPRMRARAPRHLPIIRVDDLLSEAPCEPARELRETPEPGYLFRV